MCSGGTHGAGPQSHRSTVALLFYSHECEDHCSSACSWNFGPVFLLLLFSSLPLSGFTFYCLNIAWVWAYVVQTFTSLCNWTLQSISKQSIQLFYVICNQFYMIWRRNEEYWRPVPVALTFVANIWTIYCSQFIFFLLLCVQIPPHPSAFDSAWCGTALSVYLLLLTDHMYWSQTLLSCWGFNLRLVQAFCYYLLC